VTENPRAIYVHFLLLSDVDQARRTIAHLERLVLGALGESTQRRAVPTKGETA